MDRLDEIEALLDTGDFALILPKDVRWLIAEVKRLRLGEPERLSTRAEAPVRGSSADENSMLIYPDESQS
jgi:hypothetical protein